MLRAHQEHGKQRGGEHGEVHPHRARDEWNSRVEGCAQLSGSIGVDAEGHAEVAGNEEDQDEGREEGALQAAPGQNGNSSQSSSRLLILTQFQTFAVLIALSWLPRVSTLS